MIDPCAQYDAIEALVNSMVGDIVTSPDVVAVGGPLALARALAFHAGVQLAVAAHRGDIIDHGVGLDVERDNLDKLIAGASEQRLPEPPPLSRFNFKAWLPQ